MSDHHLTNAGTNHVDHVAHEAPHKPVDKRVGDGHADHTVVHKPVKNVALETRLRHDEAGNTQMHPHSHVPAPNPGMLEDIESQLQLNALLNDASPDDWNDPLAYIQRVRALERAALVAGETMIELLVRLPDERARDEHMRENGCVMTCVDATHALHRALVTYTHCTLRRDGEVVARETIMREHGAGVAALVARSLAELRALITTEMHEAGQRAGGLLRE
jgi:hypothetical protein